MRTQKERSTDANCFVRRLKLAASIVTSLVVLGGAATFAADIRYAQKGEVTTQIKFSVDELRKSMLDDKIYELTQIPEAQRTNEQRAILDRSIRQIQEINARWNKYEISWLKCNVV